MYRNKKYKSEVDEKPLSLVTRIIIIVFIIIGIYLLFRLGGNGQDWYPGKPYQDR